MGRPHGEPEARPAGPAISVGFFDAKKHRPRFESGTEAFRLPPA